jgi:predicted HAD superfamily Cof-like phosphohydrolase
MSLDTVAKNALWFEATGQMPPTPTPDVRQTAFYAGMQCEELAEKLAAIIGPNYPNVAMLKKLGEWFKAGELDAAVEAAFTDPEKVKEMLDGDIDLFWVTVGSTKAQGANGPGAYSAVDAANWDKKFPDGTFHRHPQTGKVLKPEGWKAPDLTPFIHESLR